MIDVLLDSLIDAAKLLPLLFLVYLLVEYLEHKNNCFMQDMFIRSKRIGPLLGAIFGTVPQCGFSVIASDLFSRRAISVGTLIAIFIATSDEAIPILLAHPDKLIYMLGLIGIKLVAAIVFGFLTDFIVKTKIEIAENETHEHFHGNCESCDGGILKSAVIHSVRIFIFIFIVNVVLGIAADFLAPYMEYITANKFLELPVSCAFGLLPNCAASVVLTELFLAEDIGLSFSALAGGLCTGAGVGLVVLFRQNKPIKQNLAILAAIYLIGIITGAVISLFGL